MGTMINQGEGGRTSVPPAGVLRFSHPRMYTTLTQIQDL